MIARKRFVSNGLAEHKSLEHKNIYPVNKLNDKCEKHNGEDYTLYCHDCHKNICIKCNSEEEHKTHKKELLEDIEPSREEIKNAKKKREDLVKAKNEIQKQLLSYRKLKRITRDN